MLQDLDYTDFIKTELEQRVFSNKSYSLRSFARDLEFSPSRLSEILSNRGALSTASALKMSKLLKLTHKEATIFVALANISNSSSKKIKSEANKFLNSLKDNNSNSISLDSFRLISDWHYFAILSTMELDEFDGTALWIGERLGLSLEKTKEALELLDELEYIKNDSCFYSLKDSSGNQTTNDISSCALRKSHKQSLSHAIETIDEIDIELRDISSMTMAIDLKKIPHAKKLIQNFRRELCQYLESGDKEEVYNLNIQLIPLTKINNNKSQRKL